MRGWLALLALTLFACDGASRDPGLAGDLRVANATYAPEPLPAAGDGPDIRALRMPHVDVRPGLRSERVTGALAPEATSIALALDGDPGHWVVTAGVPSFEEPDLPSFLAELTFARRTPPGPLRVFFSAVSADGRVGPRREAALTAANEPLEGRLRVVLRWDTEADLDLHLVMPDGTEVWSGNVNAFAAPAPGASAVDPTAWQRGGQLTLDSNANCAIDGRRIEVVRWLDAPPPGAYVARVATASMCGAAAAHWQLEAWHDGVRIAAAEGLSQAGDTRFGSRLGAGVTAAEFGVP